MSLLRALDVAASALLAQQKAIDVVSNNIANADRADYTRQRAEITPKTPEAIGGVVFGRGVELSAVRRVLDPAVESALQQAASRQGFSTRLMQGLQALAPIFGTGASAPLANALQAFFRAWQALANAPADPAQRFVVRANAQRLADELQQTRTQLLRAQQQADRAIDDLVRQANRLLDTIAETTKRIRRLEAQAAKPSAEAADLRDQRDAAIRSLARLLPVQLVQTQDGHLLLQTQSGDLLLQDGTVRHLTRAPGTGAFAGIALENGAPISISSGEIGALLALRDGRLQNDLQTLDQLAADLVFAVNQAHGSTPRPSWRSAASVPSLALSDPAQPIGQSARVQSGSFVVHLYDAAGNPTPPGGISITITAGITSMNDIAAQLNAIAGISATIGADGSLQVRATNGGTIAFGSDTSGFLAAYGLGGVFVGKDASSIALAPDVAADAQAISAGRPDPISSQVSIGDGSAAAAVFALQPQFAARIEDWIASYGADAASAQAQSETAKQNWQALQARRQAISGVNTDEELIALIRHQRAYEAAAKVIATTNRMLDALIGVLR